MYLREIKSSIFLSQFIRLYRIIDFEFPDHHIIPPKAYTPRPEQCLQFFPTPTKIEYADPAKTIRPHNALIIGQHTITNSRTVYRRFLSLQIVFQPGALYRMLGFSMGEISNGSLDAGDIFGNQIEHVNDQLYHAKNHQEMIVITELFLANLLKGRIKNAEPIDKVAQQMFNPIYSLDWYVSNSFVCHRQFDRKFIDRMGISPKEYLRVVRFDHAYRMKNQHPNMSWFNIAIECGYFDYQHLSKEYKHFTGYSPVNFFAMESPERLLGTEEVY